MASYDYEAALRLEPSNANNVMDLTELFLEMNDYVKAKGGENILRIGSISQ